MSSILALSIAMSTASHAGPPPRRASQTTRTTTTTVSRSARSPASFAPGRVSPRPSPAPFSAAPRSLMSPGYAPMRGVVRPSGFGGSPGALPTFRAPSTPGSGLGTPPTISRAPQRGPRGPGDFNTGSFNTGATQTRPSPGAPPAMNQGQQSGASATETHRVNPGSPPHQPDQGGSHTNAAVNTGRPSPSAGQSPANARPFPASGTAQGGHPAQNNTAPQTTAQPTPQTSSGGSDSGSIWSDVIDIAGTIFSLF